jgi:flagellar basal-body rod modification protein FlgD
MATVSNLSLIKQYDPLAAKTAATNDPTSTKDMTQNFLKMLTAQLQNQDPMNPTDTASMTTQLAQLNMVDGINQMKSTMTSLLSQIQSSDFMNYSSSVGKYAMAASKSLSFDGQTPINLGAQLANDVSSILATISDEKGNVIAKETLDAHKAGLVNFLWDGVDSNGEPVAAGTYNIALSAVSTEGNPFIPDSYVASMVAAIGKDSNKNPLLTLADGRTVAPSDIAQWVV